MKKMTVHFRPITIKLSQSEILLWEAWNTSRLQGDWSDLMESIEHRLNEESWFDIDSVSGS